MFIIPKLCRIRSFSKMVCKGKGVDRRCIIITLLVSLIATLTTLVVFSTHVYRNSLKNCESDCIHVNETVEMKQDKHVFENCSTSYDLGNEHFVHICLYGGEVIIDIRRFIGKRPLRIGIGLKKEHWYCLIDKHRQISNTVRDLDYNYTLFSYDPWDIPQL